MTGVRHGTRELRHLSGPPRQLPEIRRWVARVSRIATEKKHPRPWAAYQSLYGESASIAFISVHESWASLGVQAPYSQVFEDLLGEKAGREQFQAVNACLEQAESLVAVDRPDLSYADEPGETPSAFLQLTRIHARTGGQDACEELMRKVAEAIPKVDDPTRFTVYQTMMGDRLSYWIGFPLASLADLDDRLSPPDLLDRAFGPAEGGLVYRYGREAITELQTLVSVYREDLSNIPAGS